jgi:hypothetical protein
MITDALAIYVVTVLLRHHTDTAVGNRPSQTKVTSATGSHEISESLGQLTNGCCPLEWTDVTR